MAAEAKTEPPVNKVPDWVQGELFVDVLKKSVKGFSKVKSFKANAGTAAGENYATIMLRINIDIELKDGKEMSVSYMLKLPHQLEMYQQMMKLNNIFETENYSYKEVVPELEQLYRDVGVDVKFGAVAYELNGAKTDNILLEDLAPKGFKNSNRIKGLDQAHTEAALRKLAQWHAASAVRVATKGAYPEKLEVGFYREETRALMDEFNKSISQNFLKCLNTYEGNELYIDHVKSVERKITDQIIKMAKVNPLEFNVLNHGDFWSNNIMFSYDTSGEIDEVYLVDFQMLKYGSVAQDLYYFIFSSTKLEDKVAKFDYYIKFYHDNLVANLKLLKYFKAIPTLRELHKTLVSYGFWGYLAATGVMSAVLVDPTEEASFENFLSDSTEGNHFKNLLYSNPRYKKHIQTILPWLLNRGCFEI